MIFKARKVRGPPGALPAIWAAFAQQAAWKDWVIGGLIVLNALSLVAASRVASRPPDVVVVDSSGKSTYVPRSVASSALLDFLAAQKQQPSDVTVVHFTKDFVRLALSANSSTIDATWSEALAMMGETLRERLAQESAARKLLETYRALQIKTSIAIEDIRLTERTKDLIQVRIVVVRTKGTLLGDDRAHIQERIEMDLVERVVPRSARRPDGLEVVDWRFVPNATPASKVTDAR